MTITDAHELLIDFITANIIDLPKEIKDAIEKVDLFDEALALAEEKRQLKRGR